MEGPGGTKLQPQPAAHCRVTSPCPWLIPFPFLETSPCQLHLQKYGSFFSFTSSMESSLICITQQKGHLLPPQLLTHLFLLSV